MREILSIIWAAVFLCAVFYSSSWVEFVIKVFIVLATLPIWLFTASCYADQLKNDDFMKLVYGPLKYLNFVMSAGFNLLYGTIIFLEWPRELLFTNRLKRLVKKYVIKAIRWAGRINSIDRGHV